jgi:hypothetical protein
MKQVIDQLFTKILSTGEMMHCQKEAANLWSRALKERRGKIKASWPGKVV